MLSYFAFSYSMMCISILCAMFHRQYVFVNKLNYGANVHKFFNMCKYLSFEGETQHEGAAVEVVERAYVDVGVLHFEVEEPEGHLELYGELDVAQEDVEADAHAVAQVVGLQAHDGLVGLVAVLAQRGEVEAIAGSGGEVGAEVVPAHGAELELQRYVAVDGLHVARALGEAVRGQVAVLPRVGDGACDECHAWEQAQVEPRAEAQVADDGDVEAWGVIGCHTLQRLPQRVVLAEGKVEFGLGVAHLYAVVQRASVELPEVADGALSSQRKRRQDKDE